MVNPWEEDWGASPPSTAAAKMPWEQDWSAPAAKLPAPSSWLPRAITDVPAEIGQSFGENWQAFKKGLVPGQQTPEELREAGTLGRLADTGRSLLAIPGMAAAPITGAARS